MNYPAFQAGRRVSPVDGLNLNRAFPGNPAGTVTEILADYFTRTLVPVIQTRLEALQYSMDILLGRAPGQHDRSKSTVIPEPPPLPSLGIPSELLETRPDLVAAQARLNAIDYRVGEAVADRLRCQ